MRFSTLSVASSPVIDRKLQFPTAAKSATSVPERLSLENRGGASASNSPPRRSSDPGGMVGSAEYTAPPTPKTSVRPGVGGFGAGGVGAGVGAGVGREVGGAVGLGVGALVAETVGPVVGEPAAPDPTLNVVVRVVVLPLLTTKAVMLWLPAVTDALFQGLALPAVSVPTKSIGTDPSTWIAAPLIAGLSSQKLTLLMPLVGVMKI